MKAIRIEQYGGPEVLIRQDIEVPQPGPGEVLVKVRCAGINFMDIHTRQGKYKASRTYPVRIPVHARHGRFRRRGENRVRA